jgi:hypothetical protein
VCSMINAAVVGVWGMLWLMKTTPVSAAESRVVAAAMMGYFMEELFWPMITKKNEQEPPSWSDIIHHVAGILLISSATLDDIYVSRFPSFAIVEISTVWLNLGWFAMKDGRTSDDTIKTIGKIFAFSFFVIRCLWIPYASWQSFQLKPFTSRTHQGVCLGLIVVVCLQFWWMRLVITQILLRAPKGKKGGGEKPCSD